MDFHLW